MTTTTTTNREARRAGKGAVMATTTTTTTCTTCGFALAGRRRCKSRPACERRATARQAARWEGARPETLVAFDFGNAGLSVERVLAFVGDALLQHVETTTPHWRTQEPVVTHRVTFDARKVRNTEVHGVSFHSGFVSHVE